MTLFTQVRSRIPLGMPRSVTTTVVTLRSRSHALVALHLNAMMDLPSFDYTTPLHVSRSMRPMPSQDYFDGLFVFDVASTAATTFVTIKECEHRKREQHSCEIIYFVETADHKAP